MADAIFIAGYYRSGTSALAGALSRLGVTIHNDAEPNEHNPLGFYEIPELIEYDVALFAQLGVEWTDLNGLPGSWWTRPDLAGQLARLDEILRRRFGHETLWALKHPHLCRLFPLYERAAAQAGHKLHAIHIARDPWSIAASQQRKNGLSRAHAVLLWADYLISAEAHARHLPRSWLTYQALLDDPGTQLKRIEADLSLDLCNRIQGGLAAAAASLTRTLDRSRPVADADLLPAVKTLATRLWDAVQSGGGTANDWDEFAAALAEITGFLAEINASGGRAMPGFGGPLAAGPAAPPELRPAERTDDGARQRLLALAAAGPALPSIGIVISAPVNRAHAISETLASLTAQWQPPAAISIIAADKLEIPGHPSLPCGAEAGALTAALCAEINAACGQAGATDYIAILNAGDTLAPDACLRFALTAAASATAMPDMIYCDEIVPNDHAGWVRRKPGWDITRLRQSAYLGDWVWYKTATLQTIGGFDPDFAGAEEYDVQLRLAEAGAAVSRLPEALFTRARHSRRDNIPSTLFGARAAAAITAHLARSGLSAQVEPRQYLGLFAHHRTVPDPGTAIILLCDGASVAMLDGWLKTLLTQAVLTGPVILAGTELPSETVQYLAEVNARASQLEGKVLAIPVSPGLSPAQSLRRAVALAETPLAAIIEARSQPAQPDWQAALRACLADPGVAIAAARILVPLARDPSRFSVQGPIIPGADTRLGAGHLADDPGPGGWLAVDQQASALSPPCLLRRSILAACEWPELTHDALWVDLCAQITATGQRLVWSPDTAFILPGAQAAASIQPDYECRARTGSTAARTALWQDPYHHPALSLRGDLLAPELRLGLVRPAPADEHSLLLSGPAAAGMALLNAARTLRATGKLEANWVGDHMLSAELGRRAPSLWLRINPANPPPPHAQPYHAVFTAVPPSTAKPAIAAASRVFATSPGIAARVKKLGPPGRNVTLWRPSLSAASWADFNPNGSLNTLPRILYIDEAAAPDWWPALIAQTKAQFSWIVISPDAERPASLHPGALATLPAPADEQGWAAQLAAMAPQLVLRPAAADADADHYLTLIAAAAGCRLLLDDRLDTPKTLPAQRLPSRLAAWQHALADATGNLTATLATGALTRAAAMALPSTEAATPPWLTFPPRPTIIRAAE